MRFAFRARLSNKLRSVTRSQHNLPELPAPHSTATMHLIVVHPPRDKAGISRYTVPKTIFSSTVLKLIMPDNGGINERTRGICSLLMFSELGPYRLRPPVENPMLNALLGVNGL